MTLRRLGLAALISGLGLLVMGATRGHADGSTFNLLASYDLTNSAFTRAVVPIPGNQADLFIRFQLSVDDTEVANVDNLVVDAVPLPTTLPLFASGLGVMAWLARRRKWNH